MAAKHTYIFHLLDLLSNGRPRSVPQIREHLLSVRRLPTDLEEVLLSLQRIGVLRTSPQGEWMSGAARSQVVGGGNANDPPSALGGDSDGEGGAGLAEVLAHPVLLCLPVEAQDSLLDAAFGADRSGDGRFA